MVSSKRNNKVDNSLFGLIGFLLLSFGILIILKIYLPVAGSELKYQVTKTSQMKAEITPINTNFSIVIPKIGVNANVVKNVDPNNPSEYQKALTKGVAHALGSGLPGYIGNTFIFAHSASSWTQANQFNAIFYLTNKLEKGDKILIYFENSKYTYTVTDKKIVKSDDIDYLNNSTTDSILTLMTCWPPGTTIERLVIVAKAN